MQPDLSFISPLTCPIEHNTYKFIFLLPQTLISALGFFRPQDVREDGRKFESFRLEEIKGDLRVAFDGVFEERLCAYRIAPFMRAFERDTTEWIKMHIVKDRGEVGLKLTTWTSQQNHFAIFTHKRQHIRYYRWNASGFDKGRDPPSTRQTAQPASGCGSL